MDESMAMYEQSQRDLRNKQQELQRTNAELDKTREMKDQLARENKKLAGMFLILRVTTFHRASGIGATKERPRWT